MEYYSQYEQDLYIDKILNKKNKGFFIDIGAHDGVTISNSLFFEKNRSWQGICFEPIPEIFEKLKQNRQCYLYNAAIYPENVDDLKFTRCHGYTEMLSGLSEFRSEDHKNRTKDEINQYDGSVEEISVKGMNLNQILLEKKIQEVDYISIDIEGGELEVLKSIDFNQIEVNCLTIENNYNDPKIISELQKNGFYHLSKYKSDDFFVNNTFYSNNKERIEEISTELKAKQNQFISEKHAQKRTSLLTRIKLKIATLLKKHK